MNKAEFDKFAEEYSAVHRNNIRASGESPEYFAEYKVADIARELGDRDSTAKILDFGSGVGNSIPYVRKYFPDASLTCLDVSERSLEIAEQRFANLATYVPFDGNTIPCPTGEFDIAFAACVFHHIDGSQHLQLLKELSRVLSAKGWLFIFEHNPLNPLTRHAVNTCPFDENAVLIRGGRMRDMFVRSQFAKVVLKYRIFFPGALHFLRPIERVLIWLPLGAQYYVCGQKAK